MVVLAHGLLEGFVAPGEPIYWVFGVLEKVGAFRPGEPFRRFVATCGVILSLPGISWLHLPSLNYIPRKDKENAATAGIQEHRLWISSGQPQSKNRSTENLDTINRCG